MSSSIGGGGLFVPSRKGSAMPFMTGDEKQRYDKTFLSLLPGATAGSKANQLLGGEKVKEVFLKSGLPAKTLGLIWEKSDLTKDGKLDEKEFSIAMCLIEHVLGGQTVPSTLPQQLINMTVHTHSGPTTAPAFPTSQQSTASPAAPGGPPPQFTSDPFGGFGNSFIPGAPVAGPMAVAGARSGPMLPAPPLPNMGHSASGGGGFPPTTAPPVLPTMPPPPHSGATATSGNSIDAAFGGGSGGGGGVAKLYPTLPTPPAIPMRNDVIKSMTMSSGGFDAFQVGAQQPVPPRRDSLAMNAAVSSSDWLVPPASRNKYRQQFSLNDPGRTGIMGSNLARNILLQTNVDTNILARIWDLSNLRGQGNLNPDEFTLAMHLCDMVKTGEPLPSTLPLLLIPPSLRDQKMNAFGAPLNVSVPPVPTAAAADASSAEQPPQKQLAPDEVSFEDKLRQNFDRGEQALEEKRKALMEQERREKEERMMKERHEEERRARERAEQEKKKAEQWAEQQRRMEEARKEAEAKAQAEHDRRVALTLESRIASARSQMTQLRSQNSQLDSDIQVLAAKKRSLDEQLSETKNSEEASSKLVKERNDKCFTRKKHLEQLQLQLQEYQRSLKQYTDKRISIAEQLKQQTTRHPIEDNLVTAERHSQVMTSVDGQKRKVERLKQQILAAEKETADKFHRIDQLNVQISQCKTLLQQEHSHNEEQNKKKPIPEATQPAAVNSDFTKSSKPAAVTGSDPFGDAFGGGGGSAAGVTNSNDPFAPADSFSTTNGADDFFKSISSAVVENSSDPFASTTGVDPFKAGDFFTTNSFSSSNATLGGGANNQTTTFNMSKQPDAIMSTSASAAPGQDTAAFSSAGSTATTTGEVYFEALYDFTTGDEGDLPFKAGDIIVASAEQNLQEPWLAGFLNGVGGWFPQNYTRRLDSKPPAASTCTSQPQQQQNNNSSGGSHVKSSSGQNLFNQLSSTSASAALSSNSFINTATGATAAEHTDNSNSSTNQFNQKSSTPPNFSSSSASASSSSAAASPQILCKVRATYPFEATAEGDLGLAAGDEVSVTSKDGDWWTGFLSTDPNSTQGIFPSNFVEVIQSFTTMATSATGTGSSSVTSPQTLTLPTGSDTSGGTGASKGGQELASVIAEFHGDSPEQLNLAVGDVVIVKKKLDSGWWEGQIQGEKKKGWFPGDYVRLISSGLTPMASANSSPERKVPGSGGAVAAERVRAQFAFTAERDDELTFNVGDVINILSKDDNDWWKGELRGRSGLFPSNFVSPL